MTLRSDDLTLAGVWGGEIASNQESVGEERLEVCEIAESSESWEPPSEPRLSRSCSAREPCCGVEKFSGSAMPRARARMST